MTKKQSELVVAEHYTAEHIPDLLKKVDAKIAELKGTADKKPSTIGTSFPGVGLQIKNINKIEDLLMINGTINAKEKAYNDSIKELNLTIKTPEFKIAGFTAKVWKEDIRMRIQEVAYEDQLKKLEKVKETLETNLSADQKLANDLKKCADIMSDL